MFRRSFFAACTLLLFPLALLICSCDGAEPALFPVRSGVLTAASREAATGVLDFSKPKKLAYRFSAGLVVPPLSSLEIEYYFTLPPANELKARYQLVLEIGGNSWALPMDLSFLGIETDAVIHYAIPIEESFSGQFSIALLPGEPGTKQNPPRQGELPRFQIKSLEIKSRWFGFYCPDPGHVYTSPFVYRQDHDRYVIDIPASFSVRRNLNLLPEINAALLPGRTAVLEAGGRRYEVSPHPGALHIPPSVLPAHTGPLVFSGGPIQFFTLTYSEVPPFPAPITADPGLIIEWPHETWRNSRYEVFRWENFPSLLIFDTADYAAQDRLLKRLAFFTEKAGFRGRLAADEEIAELHGWNAHDYRAVDLARFFDLARKTNFPLLPEERELEGILLKEGIIRPGSGGINAGEGGIISISRESAAYLRNLFLAHESFHGLFFIDEDFRAFSRRRWEQLAPQAKGFIISYFDYQHYDIKDEYLMINEFMAHILQQPVSQAGRYFGETLASRIESSSWRRTVLPEKDEASNSWPALAVAFIKEAEAFSAYVNQRWGLSAGRVRMVTASASAR
ncbi:hypothetical protein AGMMS50293_06500 [Spirochaetia bacterium]|nr:hypothetical protein AGMMS50293_06500 [Spirochaetia bacterium]